VEQAKADALNLGLANFNCIPRLILEPKSKEVKCLLLDVLVEEVTDK
jgi:hypothetical protein